MTLRSAAAYLAGLHDGRAVYSQGSRVEDVVAHELLGPAARHAAIEFDLAADPNHRSLAVIEAGPDAYSAYYRLPLTPADLSARSRLIQVGTAAGGTLVLLVKEIGTDAIFGLTRVLARAHDDKGLARVRAFHELCRDGDLALAVAQTDAKGDRTKSPMEQADPDLYVHVVDRRTDGIVVRGAKLHTSCAPYVDEVIVLPGRSLSSADSDYGVAFAVPVATPGLSLYASSFLPPPDDTFIHPVSARHRMMETLTVFDDVFVPNERVFFVDRPDLAGPTAEAFVEHHRFTAVSYKLPLLDALLGASFAIAEANGIQRASHVRDKLTWIIGYVESVRALLAASADRADVDQGIAVPDALLTNLAQWTFARDYHELLEIVQDLSGGLLVTGPSGADWHDQQTRAVLQKYLGGATSTEVRLSLLNLIADLTTGAFGGYQAVLAIHAEGSLEAEKLAIRRAFDPGPAVALVTALATHGGTVPPPATV